jgi:small subunit ribosomal protein S17
MAKSEQKAKNIGVEVVPPKDACSDENCPFHGTLGVRGKILEGTVVSVKAQRTIVVEKEYLHFMPKYERYMRKHTRISAHKPDCIHVKSGDKVRIAECRPLSKTKHFVVIEVTESGE